MGTYRRINVRSGRPLEQLAHYARALRVGDTVLQSGTTAIDREGNVHGEGDVAQQVDAIMSIAAWSMEQAGGKLDDVVRSRIYLTDISLAEPAALALAKYFRDVRPVSTLVQVNRLARPAQLIEIEFDAVDGAKNNAQRISSGRDIEDKYAYSRAIRVDDRIFIAGTTALNPQGQVEGPDDMYTQTRRIMDTIHWALEEAGGKPEDLVYSKTFVTDLARGPEYTRAFLEAVGSIRPTSTLLGIPALISPQMLVEIEAEAFIGAAEHRREFFTAQERERARGYARAVEVGDRIFVSGCTSLSPAGEPQAPGDWAAQYDLALGTITSILDQAGARLDDVVRRRTFTVDGARQNRSYGAGPPLFANSCPVSLGCRVAGLALPALLVEVEVEAWKGAHADIEWVGPAEVDPLSG